MFLLCSQQNATHGIATFCFSVCEDLGREKQVRVVAIKVAFLFT